MQATLLGVLLCCSTAAARGTSLNWVRGHGAQSCPGAGAVADALERTIGENLVSSAAAETVIEAQVVRSDGGVFRAHAVLADQAGAILGERSWTVGSDCAEVLDQVVFVVAVTLDPTFLERMSEALDLNSERADPGGELLAQLRAEAPGPRAAHTAQAPHGPEEAEMHSPVEDVGRPGRAFLGMDLGLLYGLQPSVAPVVSLSVGYQHGELAGALTLGALWPGTADTVGGTAAFVSGNARADLCWSPWTPTAALLPQVCAGLGAGLQHASGNAFDENLAATRWLPALHGGVALHVQAGRVPVLLRGIVFWHAVRPAFAARQGDFDLVIYRAPAFAWTASIGTEIDL